MLWILILPWLFTQRNNPTLACAGRADFVLLLSAVKIRGSSRSALLGPAPSATSSLLLLSPLILMAGGSVPSSAQGSALLVLTVLSVGHSFLHFPSLEWDLSGVLKTANEHTHPSSLLLKVGMCSHTLFTPPPFFLQGKVPRGCITLQQGCRMIECLGEVAKLLSFCFDLKEKKFILFQVTFATSTVSPFHPEIPLHHKQSFLLCKKRKSQRGHEVCRRLLSCRPK